MKLIPLTRGLFAQVDDEDFDYLNQWKWYAQKKAYTFYACRKDMISGRVVFMHRVIIKTPDGLFTDHINGNGLDNCKSNLRFCNHKQNAANSKKRESKKYKGVYINKNGTIYSAIYCDGRDIYLGSFKTINDAAIAHDKAAKYYHGEFADLNFK